MITFTKAGHVSGSALGLYAMNDLPASRRTPVEAHVLHCESCWNEFVDVRRLIALLRTLAARGNNQRRPHCTG